MFKKIIAAAALMGALGLAGTAAAATGAIATTDVNLRAGPSTSYPAVDVVGSGDTVRVHGCLSNRSWCDVSYRGIRGWMSSNYLAYLRGGRRYTGPEVVGILGAPTIGFAIGSYWDNYYRGRPFYSHRDRYVRYYHGGRDYDRDDFRRDRRDYRHDRRDYRHDRRDDRRDRGDFDRGGRHFGGRGFGGGGGVITQGPTEH